MNSQSEIVRDFLAESLENLEELDRELLRLEKDPDCTESLSSVFRTIHTIKGTSSFLGFSNLESLTHEGENLLSRVREGQLHLDQERTSALLDMIDAVRVMLDSIDQDQTDGDDDYADLITTLLWLQEADPENLPAPASHGCGPNSNTDPAGSIPAVNLNSDLSAASRAASSAATGSTGAGGQVSSRNGEHPNQTAGAETNLIATPHTALSAATGDVGVRGQVVSSGADSSNQTTGVETDLVAAPCAASSAATGSAGVSDQVVSPSPAATTTEESQTETNLIAAPRVASTAAGGSTGVSDQVVCPSAPMPGRTTDTTTDLIAASCTASTAATGRADAGDQVVSPSSPMDAPAPAKRSGSASDDGHRSAGTATLRIDVDLLDRIMDLVGELVLVRNQFVLRSDQDGCAEFTAICQQLSCITSDLQDCVIRTRMQSIDRIWSMVPRQVRDLATECGKQVRVETAGNETELDKSIIEAIKGPITHLIRNCVDHGLESPEERQAAGKPAEGCVRLNARHESGKVLIEVSDDGRGIDVSRIRDKAIRRDLVSIDVAEQMTERQWLEMIFDPGFTTRDHVTSLSGRGVGLDVVKTNIESLSGSIEVRNTPGAGTTFYIKIPLTLAIIPALIVSEADRCYAIPQTNLTELVQLSAEALERNLETVFGTDLFRLRGELMPLVRLREVLRVAASPAAENDRASDSVLNIVVVDTGQHRFGLIVDSINDTQEIVIKPLSHVLRALPVYSGATILGDGQMALIMDVGGIAQQSGLTMNASATLPTSSLNQTAAEDTEDSVNWLVVEREEQQQLIDMRNVLRLEDVRQSAIETSGGRAVLQYRGRILELLNPPQTLTSDSTAAGDVVHVVVITDGERQAGYVVNQVIDIEETTAGSDDVENGSPVVIRNRVSDIVDVPAVLEAV